MWVRKEILNTHKKESGQYNARNHGRILFNCEQIPAVFDSYRSASVQMRANKPSPRGKEGDPGAYAIGEEGVARWFWEHNRF